MKKLIIALIILVILALLSFGGYKYYKYYQIKNAKIEVKLKDDLTIEFRDKKKVSDFIESINGKIVKDYEIDSTKVGKQKIKFDFVNDDGIKVKYEYEIEVKDVTPPVAWIGSSYSVAVGSTPEFIDNILCGDDTDPNPMCEIDGVYDLNTVGVYPVKFKATDKSGNLSEIEFNLKVYDPDTVSSNDYDYTPTKTYFSDVVRDYKNANTKIGIDVSGWQDEIDFEKIKAAGVEFIIIRVGGTLGTNMDFFVDGQFKRNIELANEYGIPVGLYFFSYAASSKETINEAKWVLDQIKGYKIDLPIAFDWEDFRDFNSYHISFWELTKMASDFIDVVEDAGYTGMIYGSKNYLEEIWLPYEYDTWLAHYTDKTSYKGDYKFWQLCDDGVIDGINGSVDIDIMYENNKSSD